VVDQEGEKIGKVDELYYDERGDQPEWALVTTGVFGTKKTFIPIRRARPAGENLQRRRPVQLPHVKEMRDG
jgi:uncharacterized protein YrrD